ncbi:sporulation protein YqfD [Cohnella nanjingensis]|uniref:Sporulation protein YqfD n=1 Tax=Cohnella nanjingensis TaxID=1387779 RepID=A0A7X0VIU7_9BACL|nr:sporulation protein YqfD [Cohnella nanjingensis]MBB6675311.1 sporulation protein YqfD [Cohnella nanjingensis]
MKGLWLSNVRGYVQLKLIGGDAESLLNAVTAQRIPLWDIAFAKDGAMTFRVTVPDFFRLRPLLKRTGCRTRILERRGFPFQMARLSKRKVFAGGLLVFVTALFLLSMLVWDVQVKTEAPVGEEQVLQAARQEGLRPFQWSFLLRDPATIAHGIARRLPEAAWVGVEKSGTRVTITVVKSNKPEVKKPQSPSHLVATTDAVVTRIVAESGRPKVQRNERVRKGEVLISGIIGEDGRTKSVVSKGEVKGLVWHEYKIVSPLTRKVQTYTGETNDRGYLVIGNRALQTSGYKAPSFAQSEFRYDRKQFALGRWTLPIGVLKEKEREVSTVEETLTPLEAKEAGLAQARTEVLAAAGRGASIKAEKLLHEHTENGKVMINILFEVEQSIAVERPILQMSNTQGE